MQDMTCGTYDTISHQVSQVPPEPGELLRLLLPMNYGQTTESGIPPPFRATMRYSRIHLDFSPPDPPIRNADWSTQHRTGF